MPVDRRARAHPNPTPARVRPAPDNPPRLLSHTRTPPGTVQTTSRHRTWDTVPAHAPLPGDDSCAELSGKRAISCWYPLLNAWSMMSPDCLSSGSELRNHLLSGTPPCRRPPLLIARTVQLFLGWTAGHVEKRRSHHNPVDGMTPLNAIHPHTTGRPVGLPPSPAHASAAMTRTG